MSRPRYLARHKMREFGRVYGNGGNIGLQRGFPCFFVYNLVGLISLIDDVSLFQLGWVMSMVVDL